MAPNPPETKQACPECGKQAGGNFCQHCGAALGRRFCNQCGTGLEPGVTFCNQCGAKAPGGVAAPAASTGKGAMGAVRAPSRSGGGRKGKGPAPLQPAATRSAVAAEVVGGANAPWWIAGIAMFVVIFVVGWNMVGPAEPPAPTGMGGGGASPAEQGTTDITQLTPREAADRLFDRIMRTATAGDTAAALGFQPMAIQAFAVAEPLNLDGLFHLALIQQLSDPEAALATARRMLEAEPDHVLGLGVAGEALASLGDEGGAREHFARLLEVYDVQFARTLEEYEGHRNLMAQYRATAQAYLRR